MMKSAVMIGLALGLMIGAPAAAARDHCKAAVAERLERLNVEPSDIRGISYVVERGGGRDSSRVVGISAWVSLLSCKGNLVVDMSRHCRIRQVYGRGECDLGGAVDTW